MSNNELLENPADLLKEVRENFMIEQDVNSLINIDRKIEEIQSRSQEELRSKKTDISKLHIQLDTSTSKVDALKTDLDRIKDESQELVGQNEVVDYVKELDELEQSIVSLRSQLDERIVHLVRSGRSSTGGSSLDQSPIAVVIDPEEEIEIINNPASRANLLKLKLYRSMGVVLDEDNNQVLIEGNDNAIDVLPLNDDISDFFKTKFIWDRIKTKR